MDSTYFDNRLFAGIPRATLENLEVAPVRQALGAGEILFEESDPGDAVYLIIDGSLRISKSGRGGGQETLVTLDAGDYLGEMALLDARPRSARCSAVAPAEVGRIDGASFASMLESSPAIAMNFSRLTVERLRRTDQHLIEKLLEGERLSLLGRMVGGMVHDFRNPLATVLMAAAYLKRRGGEDATLDRLARTVEGAVERMMEMTQELLDYSRGITRIDAAPVAVGELLEKVESEARASFDFTGIQVERRLDCPGSHEVRLDGGRFFRLFMNVIKNALEAMPDGGVLRLHGRREGEFFRFLVGDSGCGMSPELAARVFEPFVTEGKRNGTGLGMAIAKGVVDAHEGRIWLESEVDVGTTVHVMVPGTLRASEEEPSRGDAGHA